jgi:hypothetical protein
VDWCLTFHSVTSFQVLHRREWPIRVPSVRARYVDIHRLGLVAVLVRSRSVCVADVLLPLSPFAGSFANSTGQSACSACSQGTFSNQTGSTQCTPCAIGRTNIVPGQSVCAACAAGTFSNQTGATGCTGCAPGTSSAVSGASVCQACSIGTFSGSWTAIMLVLLSFAPMHSLSDRLTSMCALLAPALQAPRPRRPAPCVTSARTSR